MQNTKQRHVCTAIVFTCEFSAIILTLDLVYPCVRVKKLDSPPPRATSCSPARWTDHGALRNHVTASHPTLTLPFVWGGSSMPCTRPTLHTAWTLSILRLCSIWSCIRNHIIQNWMRKCHVLGFNSMTSSHLLGMDWTYKLLRWCCSLCTHLKVHNKNDMAQLGNMQWLYTSMH